VISVFSRLHPSHIQGHLPAFDAATGWLNTEPLTPDGLRSPVPRGVRCARVTGRQARATAIVSTCRRMPGRARHASRSRAKPADAGGVVANFTPVETFGAADTHWVSAVVDPRNPDLFTFRPMIVSANVY
jgi:hypothetical protein